MAVTVVDKGQGIGGRLASRRLRWEPDPQVIGIADYGALQFQVTDRRFQTQVDRWVEQGLLRSDAGLDSAAAESPRVYTGTASLRSFTQALSQGLTLHLKTRVTQLHWEASTQRWTLSALNTSHTGSDTAASTVTLPWQSTHLVLTCPVPQTLELLDQSGIPILPAQRQPLQSVHYHPCLTALLLLRNPSQIPPRGLLAGRDPQLPPELQTLRCHYRSGISPQGYAVTLQASPAFSQQHWDQDDRSIFETLISLASPWLGLPDSVDPALNSPVLTQQLHRWRYSQPAQPYAQSDRPCCVLRPNLLLGGDAFATIDSPTVSPHLSVQQGFLSGLSIAETIGIGIRE
jgi:predicted NAD/FAD-dependent oxidoreductase